MYLGGAQGLAPMAVFWNAHLNDGFGRVLGPHWRKWWHSYIDDLGAHGTTAERCLGRGRLLSTILKQYKKPFSEKPGADGSLVTTEITLAGMHVDEHGVHLGTEVLDALQYKLTQFVVKTRKDAQHVVGVIQYCSSAFDWSEDNDWLQYMRHEYSY